MRVKTGTTKRAAHKKVFKLAKGFRMSRHRLYKVAKEAVLHAGDYAFAGRKHRKRDFRQLWIIRLKAALSQQPKPLSYSRFINLLKTKNCQLNRQSLSGLATKYPQVFEKLVDFCHQ